MRRSKDFHRSAQQANASPSSTIVHKGLSDEDSAPPVELAVGARQQAAGEAGGERFGAAENTPSKCRLPGRRTGERVVTRGTPAERFEVLDRGQLREEVRIVGQHGNLAAEGGRAFAGVSPATTTVPEAGFRIPWRQRSSVDSPVPSGPTTRRTHPAGRRGPGRGTAIPSSVLVSAAAG
ncbi:hypothetical protein [Amycolatopsis minnesotensis]|uniref:Uncharacterized protein n=1 Tax=Amycolatopsis minnesotensis TaxID=337894 RepID=A0ABP5CUC3_9PSEU